MTEHMSTAEYKALMADVEPAENPYLPNVMVKLSKKLNDAPVPTKNRSMWTPSTGVITNRKPRNHEEDDITIQVAEYCELLMVQGKISCYSHIPQETFTKSWAVKNKNKAMGVRAGVPDMLIVFPDRVLFLELKRLKGGVLSEAQKAWIDAINSVQIPSMAAGHQYVLAKVACGFDEAKEAIDLCVLD